MKPLHPIRLLAVTLGLLTNSLSHAVDYAEGRKNFSPPVTLNNTHGQYNHWRGIGRLQMSQAQPEANCTASLIDSRADDTRADGPAYIVTSAHCVTRNGLNLSVDMPMDGHIEFNYFSGQLQDAQRFPLARLVSASLRGVDLAVIELQAPLQQLLDAGIEPLQLSGEAPALGTDLMIVGNPSGHIDGPGLKRSLCALEDTPDLIEEVYVFRKTQKTRCPGMAPGSSGSPMLDRQSNKVVGIVSTTSRNTREESRCHNNTPCEVKDGQPYWSEQSNYSTTAAGLQSCFRQGLFAPSDTGCVLQPTLSMTLGDGPMPLSFSRITLDEEGKEEIPTWSFAFSLDTPFYRYKAVRSPSACENPTGYSDAIAATDALIDDPIGPQPGLHMLCIIGVESQEQRPDRSMMDRPVIIAMELAEAAPSRMPWLGINRVNEGYEVALLHADPWFFMYVYKWGAPDTTDCDERSGYRQEEQDVLHFSSAELPVKLCTVVYELSGQPSAPRTDVLTP